MRSLLAALLVAGCLGDVETSPEPAGHDPDVTADLDSDGLDDAREQALAQKFAPQVRLYPAPDEWTRPTNVEWLLARSWMRFDHPHCPDHQVLATGAGTQSNLAAQSHRTDNIICGHTSTVYSSGGAHPEFFLQQPDHASHSGSANSADWRMYVHTKPSTLATGGVDIQYWFLYAYDFTSLDANHEADWEHITVTADSAGNFVSAWYAQHNGGTRYGAAALRWSGTHPVVYASLGTHASYPSAGSFYVSESGLTDTTADGGPIWDGAASFINVGEKAHPMNGQGFIRYGGRWGEIGAFAFTTGPLTPSFQPTWNSY